MNLATISKYPKLIFNTSKAFISKNSPTILTVFGAAGVVTTAIMAVKATPKAEKILKEAEEKKGEKLTVLETIAQAAPSYAPSLIMGTVTIGCILGANAVNMRRTAALASLYSVSQHTLQEYKETAEELVGKKKAKAIEDGAMEKMVIDTPFVPGDVVKTGHGDTMFFDPMVARYFTSSIEYVRHCENDVKGMVYGDMRATLNDFYFAMGLPSCELGDLVGWNAEKILNKDVITFTSCLKSDGTPCVALNYSVPPTTDYTDY